MMKRVTKTPTKSKHFGFKNWIHRFFIDLFVCLCGGSSGIHHFLSFKSGLIFNPLILWGTWPRGTSEDHFRGPLGAFVWKMKTSEMFFFFFWGGAFNLFFFLPGKLKIFVLG